MKITDGKFLRTSLFETFAIYCHFAPRGNLSIKIFFLAWLLEMIKLKSPFRQGMDVISQGCRNDAEAIVI